MDENTSQKDSNLWSMLAHLLSLVGFIGIPLGNIIGPLIVWLVKKEEFPAVDQHGKESLNFQITMTIYMIVAVVLMFVLIGFILAPILMLADIILVIMAAVKANNGESFNYPPFLCFQIIK